MCGGGIVKLSCHLPDFLERLVRQAHGPTAGSETIDALEFLARVVSHIPDKGQVLQHYYGWYASRVRGMRRKTAEAGEEHPMVCVDPEPEAPSEAGKRWAELLRRIFQVDPLACPRCGEEMRIVAFVTEPQIIDRILDHLRRTAPTRPRPRAPPRHGSPPSRPPQPSSALTYPGDHRSGIVGLPGCANHRSDITVHPGFAGNPVLFGRSSRQRDVAMLSRAVGQLQFRAAYLGSVKALSYQIVSRLQPDISLKLTVRASVVGPELVTPLTYSLVGDDDSPLRQEVLDVAEAQAELVIHPNRLTDDLGWETVSVVAVCSAVHQPGLAATGLS